jgi:hypothetical protein
MPVGRAVSSGPNCSKNGLRCTWLYSGRLHLWNVGQCPPGYTALLHTIVAVRPWDTSLLRPQRNLTVYRFRWFSLIQVRLRGPGHSTVHSYFIWQYKYSVFFLQCCVDSHTLYLKCYYQSSNSDGDSTDHRMAAVCMGRLGRYHEYMWELYGGER